MRSPRAWWRREILHLLRQARADLGHLVSVWDVRTTVWQSRQSGWRERELSEYPEMRAAEWRRLARWSAGVAQNLEALSKLAASRAVQLEAAHAQEPERSQP